MESYFSTNLKYLRLLNKDSQEELANKINKIDKEETIHYTTIGRWENGNREPSINSVIKIADVYEVPIADLVAKDLSGNGRNNEEMEKELIKKALIEKGFMNEDEDMNDEQFEVVMKIYKEFLKQQ